MRRAHAGAETGVVVGAVVAVAILAVAASVGVAFRRRDGNVRERPRRPGSRDAVHLTPSLLGQPLGERATLLQFSSSFCSPCRATRALLADVAASSHGVAYVEMDVAEHLDLVRMLDVRRTPTVFVLGTQGQVSHRASGTPRRSDVLAALSQASGRGEPGRDSGQGHA